MGSNFVGDILSKLGYNFTKIGDFYRTRPLYRDSSSNSVLSVNSKSGYFSDFAHPEFDGNLVKLVSLTLNISEKEAQEFVGSDDYGLISKEHEEKIEIQKKVDPDSLKDLLPSYGFYKIRGISEETLKFFQGGVRTYGKLNNRFIFPIFNLKGDIIALSGRCLFPNRDEGRPKWKHIGETRKSSYPLFFNKNYILQSQQIVLVESIGDMLALWENGVRNTFVCFGAKLSKENLKTLLSIPVNEIIISLNDDSASNSTGNKSSEKILDKLNKFCKNTKIVLPTGNDFGRNMDGNIPTESLEEWKNRIEQWKNKI